MPIWKRDQDLTATASLDTLGRQTYTPGTPAVDPPHPVEAPATPEPPAGSRADEGMTLPPGEPVAVIDGNSSIDGTLRSSGNVLVEGSFHGKLEADKTVLIARGAQVEAQLQAADTIVCGSFNGEIVCRQLLKIAATATISGEIRTPMLVIEEGSTVNCKFNMGRGGGY